jgi:predicted nuclease of predicted toxin-antitoxin system
MPNGSRRIELNSRRNRRHEILGQQGDFARHDPVPLGHDAKRLLEENLERLPDLDILEKARLERSIVLTNDLDFGDLLAASGAGLPSVILLRLDDMRPDNVNRYLSTVINRYAGELDKGAIISVSDQNIRVRRLPIPPSATP